MAIRLSVVTSLNGLTTRLKEGPSQWASPEDQQKFAELKAQSDVVVMGPNTYREMRSVVLNNLTDKPMRAVIRRGVEFRLDTVPEKLEFFSSVDDFLEDMEKRKKAEILLACGAALTGEFFRRGLIDELHHTVEPFIFSTGLPIGERIPNIQLQPKFGPEPLNDNGTMYTVYNVLKKQEK